METRSITSLDELQGIAEEVISRLRKDDRATVVTLTGDLGAGKTAFTKELARLLEIAHEITSPTFVIMKSYEISTDSFLKTLTHIDAYRIESDDEMRVLGFEELLKDPARLICVEWPEKIQSLIPKNAYPISLTLNLDGTRTISYGP